MVNNIPKGNYIGSVKNKQYITQAVKILKQQKNNSITSIELWRKLDLGDKKHNSQMDVVLALWNEDLIVK